MYGRRACEISEDHAVDRKTHGMGKILINVIARSEGILLRQSARPGMGTRGTYMCDCEDGHFEADERVDEGERHVLGIGIWPHCRVVSMAWAALQPRPTLLDSLCGDEERDEDALPKREEEDSLDAEEFGCAMVESARSRRNHSHCVALTDRPKGL
jgi:hypothetical protein